MYAKEGILYLCPTTPTSELEDYDHA